MASIYYKLRSSKTIESISCPDKQGLSKNDFLDQISTKMHINPFDMQLDIVQINFPDGLILQKDNKSEFQKLNYIPAFSSVVLVRTPCANYEQAKFYKANQKKVVHNVAAISSVQALPTFSSTQTEEEKIASLLNFDPLKNCSAGNPPNRNRKSTTNTPPAHYTCHNCGLRGHWKKDCNQPRLIIPRGTPKTMLQHKSLPLAATEEHNQPKLKTINVNWLCPICHNTMEDAVSISCCNKSFCSSCILQHLSAHQSCFCCQIPLGNNFLDKLVANEELRVEILNQQTTKTSSKKRTFVNSTLSNSEQIHMHPEKKIKLVTV